MNVDPDAALNAYFMARYAKTLWKVPGYPDPGFSLQSSG